MNQMFHLKRIGFLAKLLAGIFFVAASFPEISEGTTFSPVHLSRCVARAGVIAAGTVESITPVALDGTIVSEVKFDRVVYAKGVRGGSGSLTIRVLGGTLNGRIVVQSGTPQFHVGSRYVLLLKEGLGTLRDGFTPLVYFNQGLFPVFEDRGSHGPVVHDWAGCPIAGVRNGRILSVMGSSARGDQMNGSRGIGSARLDSIASSVPEGAPLVEIPGGLDPGLRLSEDEFLNIIHQLMAEK